MKSQRFFYPLEKFKSNAAAEDIQLSDEGIIITPQASLPLNILMQMIEQTKYTCISVGEPIYKFQIEATKGVLILTGNLTDAINALKSLSIIGNDYYQLLLNSIKEIQNDENDKGLKI